MKELIKAISKFGKETKKASGETLLSSLDCYPEIESSFTSTIDYGTLCYGELIGFYLSIKPLIKKFAKSESSYYSDEMMKELLPTITIEEFMSEISWILKCY